MTATVTWAANLWHSEAVEPRLEPPKPGLLDLSAEELTSLEPREVERVIRLVDRDLDRLRQRIRPVLQTFLKKLEGESFGSLEKNQQFASDLSRLLVRLGLRLKCQSSGCGEPATLQVKRGDTVTGAFQFLHGPSSSRSTHGGRTTVPRLQLVNAPPDARRKR